MSAGHPLRTRLTRIALAVRDPAQMAAELGAVFGIGFAPAEDEPTRLRSSDGYELAPAAAHGTPLRALVFSVDAIAEAAQRLAKAGAVCVADQIVDGRREMTWTGTLLNVPVIIRDGDGAEEGGSDG
jgi:hypothetical protein